MVQNARIPALRLSWMPSLCAAVIVAAALLVVRLTVWPPVPSAPTLPVPAQAAAIPLTAPAQEASPTVTYVVKPGDSLWRIFSTLKKGSPQQKGWIDFLSQTQELNGLRNPDNIHPGSTLTLTAPSKNP